MLSQIKAAALFFFVKEMVYLSFFVAIYEGRIDPMKEEKR